VSSQPTFHNRINRQVETTEGEVLWVSRSVAVVGEICLYCQEDQSWYVLLGKRGSATPDFQGFWGLPCGYLDWDESLCQALIRETWEECGVYLPGLSTAESFITSQSSLVSEGHFNDQPWAISDRTDNSKQNISMHYLVAFSWRCAPFPTVSMDHCEPGEVDAVGWEALPRAMEMQLAFNHQQRLQQAWLEKQKIFAALEITS